jgi:hypothetical protein
VREFVTRDLASALRAAVDGARMALGADELRRVLAERLEERSLIKARLTEAEQYAAEREPLIAKLRQGLALAEALLVERDEEIAKLRSGLGHAETLAFDRARELDELHKSWIWKCRIFLMRMKSRGHPHTPA